MTAFFDNITDKYQGVASKPVIQAVQKAAEKTGADFSFLMEKASAESSFNPKAHSRSSTATGLFQFIESTWLHMVKEYGPKYGLAKYADKIECEDGKLCVKDSKARSEILNLRKNPEISALMAGEFSEDNKQYLAEHTKDDVGSTELYLAHFMGANGAAKFLNHREKNGDAVAARLFPQEARANKNVFFDPSTGHARTLDEVYDVFAQKFDNGTTPPSQSAPHPSLLADIGSMLPAPAQSFTLAPLDIAQALSSFAYTQANGVLDWTREENETKSGFSAQKLSADNILLLARMAAHKA